MENKLLRKCLVRVFMLMGHGLVTLLLLTVCAQFRSNTTYRYVLDWTSRNAFGFVWVLPLILTLFGKHIGAWIITLGNIVSVGVGQYLGDYWYRIDYFGDSANGYHHGVSIWYSGVLISIGLAVVVELLIFLVRRFLAKKRQAPEVQS